MKAFSTVGLSTLCKSQANRVSLCPGRPFNRQEVAGQTPLFCLGALLCVGHKITTYFLYKCIQLKTNYMIMQSSFTGAPSAVTCRGEENDRLPWT